MHLAYTKDDLGNYFKFNAFRNPWCARIQIRNQIWLWIFNILFYYTFPTEHTVTKLRKKSNLENRMLLLKKSTIFVQLLWTFVKMSVQWINSDGKISAWLGKNCGFFINSILFFWVDVLLDLVTVCRADKPFLAKDSWLILINGYQWNSVTSTTVRIIWHV